MSNKQPSTTNSTDSHTTITDSVASAAQSCVDSYGAAYRKAMRYVAVAFVAVNLYAGSALAQTFCGEDGVSVLTSLLNTLFGLGYSIGGIGLAVTFFGATTIQAFSFLSQDQEETIKRARKKGISAFGLLFVGGIILKVLFSSIGILDCVTILPFS